MASPVVYLELIVDLYSGIAEGEDQTLTCRQECYRAKKQASNAHTLQGRRMAFSVLLQEYQKDNADQKKHKHLK